MVLLPTFAADSTMTMLSGAGRHCGRLRTTTGLHLLFKWEVSGSLLDAVGDLQGESGNPSAGGAHTAIHGKATASQLACHSSAMLLTW